MTYVESRKQKKKKPITKSFFLIIILIGILSLGALAIIKGKNLFDPVSIVSTVSAANLKETDGRTNILVLGSDKRPEGVAVTSELTDTILVVSIGRVENDVVLISLPRDLWVASPSGYQSKINAIYAYGGAEELTQVVENVLGLPIHYYGVVSFDLFKEAINTLGGVNVYVERSFTDYFYPIEGKENAPLSERYETVHFEQGWQKLDGDTALKFVRSRHGDNDEGTDFARSARQQKVISAIKDKALSLETLINPIKMKDLYEVYANNIDTNVTFLDIQSFYLLSQQVDFNKITSIVLDDRSAADAGGLLYAPEDTELYGGAYVLIPRTGDFSQMHAYVQKYVFGAK